MSRRFAFAIAALLVVVLMTSGCSSLVKRFAPKPTVVTEKAQVVTAGAELKGEVPDWMPADLPVWPGADVSGADNANDSVVFTLATEGLYKDVLAGTSTGFERAGWTAELAGEEASTTVLNVGNGVYEGVVTVSAADSGTTLEYLLNKIK